MPCTYFDTTVYDHIDKGYIPAEEVDALRAALGRGEVVAHLSLADVEELLGQWETDRGAAVRKLRIARDLVGFDGMLKQPADLLEDAVRAYAAGVVQPPPTLPRPTRRFLVSWLTKIASGSESLAPEVSQIVADVREMKERFRAAMERARDQTLAELRWESRDPEEIRALTFEAFWIEGAPQWAEAFADHLGLADACRARGIDGLLHVRAARLAVGVAISLVYSHVVEGRQPHRGDGYDLWHAVMASVADVFVTLDERLAGHLARVPVDGFQVAGSIPELLAQSGAASSS